MKKNRIVEFVQELESCNIRDWDGITKKMNSTFDCHFRLTRIEADYLTSYYKGELNFKTKVYDIKER